MSNFIVILGGLGDTTWREERELCYCFNLNLQSTAAFDINKVCLYSFENTLTREMRVQVIRKTRNSSADFDNSKRIIKLKNSKAISNFIWFSSENVQRSHVKFNHFESIQFSKFQVNILPDPTLTLASRMGVLLKGYGLFSRSRSVSHVFVIRSFNSSLMEQCEVHMVRTIYQKI